MIASSRSCLCLVVLLVVALLASPSASFECFEPISSLEATELRPCIPGADAYSKLTSGLQFGESNYTENLATNKNAFEVSFTCDPTLSKRTCNKARQAFIKA